MVFSDTSNKDGIIQLQEQHTGLGDAAISGVTATLAYFTQLTNEFLQIGHYYAWSQDKHWTFDDSNHIDFPFATTNLVDDQRDYTLPSDVLKIRGVEVMDTNGKYYGLYEMSNESDVLFNEREQETSAKPTHYRKVGLSIKLYPNVDATQVTTTAGLRVRCEREMDLFTVSDTTQEPGFAEFLHPICVYGPVWVWAGMNNVGHVSQTAERMLGQWPGLREMAEKHFNTRDNNDTTKVRSGLRYKKYR